MTAVRILALIVAGFILVAGVGGSPPAEATILPQVVTKTADTADGSCDADCSLREAIAATNLNPSLDQISFNIPGSDVGCDVSGICTIAVETNLPQIIDPVVIDGLTQPGAAAGSPKIALNGGANPSSVGLNVAANGSTIKGLIVNRFTDGIRLEAATAVHSNVIGADASGTVDLGNGTGVQIAAGSGSSIGGTLPGEGNVIAFNDTNGVVIDSAGSNKVQRNSIYSNALEGIALGGGCLPANDPQDVDTGPNGCQNHPLITGAFPNAGGTTIEGSLNSTPSTTFELDFYSNESCDPSNFGEGQTFIGAGNETTNASGDLAFSFNFASAVPSGAAITVTATDTAGNTSEFSHCFSDPMKGDVDCSGTVNAVDSLKVLRFAASLSVAQTEPCPNIGAQLNGYLLEEAGDANCNDDENSVDALLILRHNAGLSVNVSQGCRVIGSVHGNVIRGEDNFFVPTTVSAAKGKLVSYVLDNVGFEFHNIRIAGEDLTFDTPDDAASVPEVTPGGGRGAIAWQAPNTIAAVPFRCDLHPIQMTGTINVK
jgi:CSLREA domain-containing protein